MHVSEGLCAVWGGHVADSVPSTGLSELGSVCLCKASGCMCHMGRPLCVLCELPSVTDSAGQCCWDLVQGQQQHHRFLPDHLIRTHASTQLQNRSAMPSPPCKSQLPPSAPVGQHSIVTSRTQPFACCPECCGGHIRPEGCLRNGPEQLGVNTLRQLDVCQCLEATAPLVIQPPCHQEAAALPAYLSQHQVHYCCAASIVLWHHHTHSSVPTNLCGVKGYGAQGGSTLSVQGVGSLCGHSLTLEWNPGAEAAWHSQLTSHHCQSQHARSTNPQHPPRMCCVAAGAPCPAAGRLLSPAAADQPPQTAPPGAGCLTAQACPVCVTVRSGRTYTCMLCLAVYTM